MCRKQFNGQFFIARKMISLCLPGGKLGGKRDRRNRFEFSFVWISTWDGEGLWVASLRLEENSWNLNEFNSTYGRKLEETETVMMIAIITAFVTWPNSWTSPHKKTHQTSTRKKLQTEIHFLCSSKKKSHIKSRARCDALCDCLCYFKHSINIIALQWSQECSPN